MRVVCVSRENADYARGVREWLEGFRRQTGREIEVLNPDENVGFCEVYDIVEYPTILVVDEAGRVLASWRGTKMPLIDEVLYYML